MRQATPQFQQTRGYMSILPFVVILDCEKHGDTLTIYFTLER